MPKTTAKRETRQERVPVSGLRDIMTVDNKDEAFEYRWVVDSDERGQKIMRYQKGGYDLVSADEVVVGQPNVYKSEHFGSIVRLPSGNGQFSYLMKIRREWYEEDQEAKQSNIDALEASMSRKSTRADEADDDLGQYGSVKITR